MEEIDHQKLSFSEEEEEETESEEEIAVDDSEEDPDFDVLEETRSSLSRLSLKKTKSRISKVIDSGKDEEPDDVEIKVPELNAKDAKSFENVEKIIAAGQLEKLKVEQCKIYLRKNGLRLTGKKDVLMERIKEHLGIINGGGEQKYPVSSFVYNCKGDACTGDVVMFEQNVYEMYNVASRSATGPPCGTRTVAGRIVKESYGSAKQQHTFTIEVLWSKGVKPLPPLHPLLIKGRNLYKLKTMRQLWADEEMRRKVLLEKHSRGSLARSNRETRKKEMRKKSVGQRVLRNERNTVLENQLPAIHTKQPTQFGHNKPALPPKKVLTEVCVNTTMTSSITEQRHDGSIKIGNVQSNGYQVANHRQNHTSDKVYQSSQAYANANKLQHNGIREVEDKKSSRSQFPRNTQQHANNLSEKLHQHNGIREVEDKQSSRTQFPSNTQQHASNVTEKLHQSQHSNVNQSSFNAPPRNSILGRAPSQRQVCKYYPQGRCYFGKNCKYLHEDRGKHVNGARRIAKPSYPNKNESSFNAPPWSPTRRSFNSSLQSPTRRSFNAPAQNNFNENASSFNAPPWSPTRRSFNAPAQNSFNCPPRSPNHRSFNSPLPSPTHNSPSRGSFNCPPWSPSRGGPPKQQQVCRYYAQGRCYQGENCKYLHER